VQEHYSFWKVVEILMTYFRAAYSCVVNLEKRSKEYGEKFEKFGVLESLYVLISVKLQDSGKKQLISTSKVSFPRN
jgi:hypothetical protein